MKKSLMLCICLVLLLSILLCSCSFAWDDDNETVSIEKIERVVDAGGVVWMVITYKNVDKVDRFILPEGNGIQDVDHVLDEENKETVITINYTNGTSAVVRVPYGEDGKDGASVTEVKLEYDLNNEPCLIFYVEDAEGMLVKQGSININELKGADGKDGVGIESWEYFSDDFGTGAKIKLNNDDEERTYYFNYFREVSCELVGDEYIITVRDKKGEIPDSTFAIQRQPTWFRGDNMPSDNDGIIGDFYYDSRRQVIYTKVADAENPTVGYWKEVIKMAGEKNTCTVTFDAGKGTIEGYDAYKTDNISKNVYELNQIPYNTYFYDTYGAIPVPVLQGYRFLGWYRSLTPTVNEAPFNDFVLVTNNIVLNARWEKED